MQRARQNQLLIVNCRDDCCANFGKRMKPTKSQLTSACGRTIFTHTCIGLYMRDSAVNTILSLRRVGSISHRVFSPSAPAGTYHRRLRRTCVIVLLRAFIDTQPNRLQRKVVHTNSPPLVPKICIGALYILIFFSKKLLKCTQFYPIWVQTQQRPQKYIRLSNLWPLVALQDPPARTSVITRTRDLLSHGHAAL